MFSECWTEGCAVVLQGLKYVWVCSSRFSAQESPTRGWPITASSMRAHKHSAQAHLLITGVAVVRGDIAALVSLLGWVLWGLGGGGARRDRESARERDSTHKRRDGERTTLVEMPSLYVWHMRRTA